MVGLPNNELHPWSGSHFVLSLSSAVVKMYLTVRQQCTKGKQLDN